MTRTQSGANWSDVPSLSHLWMAALLRLIAMFVAGAVSTLQMLLSRLPRACHTDVTPDRLPAAKNGNPSEKDQAAEEHSPSIEALMVSSEQSSRLSNHEGGLTIRATRAITSPWKGEVGANAVRDGWGSLRPAPADQSEPHPSFASQKLTSPFQGEVKTAPT